jgi:DNA-binding NarL/FixJ family response regulator
MTKKVVVAEDDATLASVLHATLEAVGYEVVAVVESGEDALHLALSEQPDIVVMDVSLAGAMNGIETAERLRRRSGCPVVFHTAHRDAGRVARMEAVRKSAIVQKPGDVARLLKAMSLLVNADG